MSVKRRLPQS